MRLPLTKFFLVTISLCCFAKLATAQIDPMSQKITEWYLEERFIIADQNDDALLDRDEMLRFPREFTYYLVERHFQLSDKNRDGLLSFNELYHRVRTEFIYRQNMDRKDLRALEESYPQLADLELSYLKQHPQLVVRLFANLSWMYSHSELAESLYEDKLWTSQHPEALVSLQKNLCWMASNPIAARILYKNNDTNSRLPEMLGWRASHKDFFRRHPKLDQFYEMSFWPTNIQLGRR